MTKTGRGISDSVLLTWHRRHCHGFTGEGLVHNELGLGGKVEGTKGIKVVFVLGCDVCYHDGVRRATQGILKQPRQLTVSVRNADGGARVKRVHDLVESEQGQVDGAALLQADALVAGAPVVLGPGEVYQVQLSSLFPVGGGTLGANNLEHGRFQKYTYLTTPAV